MIHDKYIHVYIFDRLVTFRRAGENKSKITFRANGVFEKSGGLGDLNSSDLDIFFGQIYYKELEVDTI